MIRFDPLSGKLLLIPRPKISVGGGGGGGGASGAAQNLFIQDTQPVTTETTYMWVETSGGEIVTFWVETGV